MQVQGNIRLEVSQQALLKLFEQQRLAITDFRCLDRMSKEQVKHLWLKCLSRSFQDLAPLNP